MIDNLLFFDLINAGKRLLIADAGFSGGSLVVLLAIFISALLIVFFVKKFSSLSFDSIDSYTSYGALIKKMRAFSALAMVLIPLVAYYESEFLNLYKTNWELIGSIAVISLFNLVISFSRKLNIRIISILLGTHFIYVISIIYLIAFQKNLNSTIVVEACVLLLLARAMFPKLKHVTRFFIYTYALIGVLILVYSPELQTLNVLISTILLSTLTSFSIILVEGSSVNNLAFANKVLKNSDLFVLVYDGSGKVVYVSKPLLKATSKLEKELLNYGWWEFSATDKFDKVILKNKIVKVLEEGTIPKYTEEVKTNNGVIDIEWSDFSLEGKFVMSIGKDVTNELKSQREVEMLSLVATSVTNGVCITDPENKLIWNNDQFKELVGLQEQNVLGKDVIQMLVPTNVETGSFIEDLAQIKPNSSQTILFKNATGTDKFVMLSNSVVLHEDKSERKKILVWTDITDQYKIEKRYKDIINNAFDNIYTISLEGLFTYVNSRTVDTLGKSVDSILGSHYLQLIDDSCKQDAIDIYQKQITNKEPYSYFEFKINTSDNRDLWVGQNVRLVLDDTPERNIVEMHAVARDITESKRNGEQLKRLSYVAQNTGSIVIILDPEFKIEWINEAFTEVFGYSIEEVKGRNPGDFLNGKNTSIPAIDRISDKLSVQEHVSEELVNYDKFGNEKWIEINMDPILDENKKIINYIAVENDITDRKSKEILIGEQHKSIIDSLNYASIIQNATLPTERDIELINKNVGVYYRPKDIIGGDFYLIDSMVNKHGHAIEIYIVADCTGHGVPGAMLSVLCSSLLKEALRNPMVKTPAQALEFTRKKLIEVFNSNKDYSLNDGMDISVCVVDRETGILDYCGANRPLFIYQEGELKILKGDKQSVGFNHVMVDFTYTRHVFSKGDTLYLFSDGIIDQFGGPKYKKFMTSRFKESIEVVKDFSVRDQVKYMTKEVQDWQGNSEQTDDVCLMVVEL